MGLTYKNDPDILEETIQQLQTSGIQFSIKVCPAGVEIRVYLKINSVSWKLSSFNIN